MGRRKRWNLNYSKMTDRAWLVLTFLAVFLFCFPFLKMEYATDTYTIEQVGMEAFGDSMFQNGRLVSAAAFYLFDTLWPQIGGFYYVSLLLALVFAPLAIFFLGKLLLRWVSAPVAYPLAFFTLLNPLAVEYFLFIEKGYFMLALCMSVLALWCLVRVWEGKWQWLALSCLCLAVAAFTYQTLPGAFAVLAVPFALLCAKSVKQAARNLWLAVAVYGVGALPNFLFLKWIGGSQRVGEGIRFSNLQSVFAFAVPIASVLLYLLGFFLLFLLCGLFTVRLKRGCFWSRASLGLFVPVALTVLGGLVVTFVPFLFVAPSQVWFPCRVLYPLGTLLGTLPLLVLRPATPGDTEPVASPKKRTARLTCGVLTGVLLLNFVFFQAVAWSRLRNNALDEELCERIGALIEAYEAQTGEEILTVCIYHDAAITKHNPGVLYLGDSNVRAFSKDWSDVDHMNVILGRAFVESLPDGQVYAAHFANRNWDCFDEEQLVFDGQTLHLCVY